VVDNIGDVIVEHAGEGTDLVQAAVTYALSANVENLTLTGTAAINGTGNELDNVITGNTAANTLNGGAGNDALSGGAGDDVLYGGLGDDKLDGGTGSDIMYGGAGNDIYIVDAATEVVTEYANEGIDLVQSAVTYALTANVENLTLTGSASINGTGNELDNIITGNSGANILDGGDGNDTLYGGSGNDTLRGGLGHDRLDGGSGSDNMSGGDGNDTYVVDSTGDVVTEAAGQGTDTVESSISYTLGSNVENLTLTGTSAISGTGNALDNVITGNDANNTLNGGDGNDTLDGRGGNDTMYGGLGNDTFVVDSTGDVVIESAGQGTDTVLSSVNYALGNNVENLTLTGLQAINGTGNTLNNIIVGNNADNVLDGGAGDDTLTGGLGNDTLLGGDGNDLFIYMRGHGSDTMSGGAGASWSDTIQLSQANGALDFGTDWTVSFTSGGVAHQNGHDLQLTQDSAGTITFTDGSTVHFSGMEHIKW
jgi:trimeric autotransporter adhesin